MENASSREHQPPSTGDALEALSKRLGFVENNALRAIRELTVEAAASNKTEQVRALLEEYQAHGEQVVNNLQGSDHMSGQIGLIISKASLHRAVGNIEAFLMDIKDAKDYAYNIHDDETVAVLEKSPSVEIARVLAAFGEEYGFDDETVAEIASDSYDQAFETAYGYLMQAGIDADEVLSDFIEESHDASE